MHLTLIGGYRYYDTIFSFDVDDSPIALENTRNNSGEHDTTGEARFSGNYRWLDWVTGVFLLPGRRLCARCAGVTLPGSAALPEQYLQAQERSRLCQSNVHPIDRVTLSLGTRYSHDEKPVNYSNLQDATPSGNIIST